MASSLCSLFPHAAAKIPTCCCAASKGSQLATSPGKKISIGFCGTILRKQNKTNKISQTNKTTNFSCLDPLSVEISSFHHLQSVVLHSFRKTTELPPPFFRFSFILCFFPVSPSPPFLLISASMCSSLIPRMSPFLPPFPGVCCCSSSPIAAAASS